MKLLDVSKNGALSGGFLSMTQRRIGTKKESSE